MEKKFEGTIVGITGYSSKVVDNDSMARKIIELEGGIISGDNGNNEEWEIEQMIFIGDEDFDKNYLIQSVEVGIANNFTCRYYSVDDFWDVYCDISSKVGTQEPNHEPYHEGDPRIEEHAGLSFLASLYFKYPNVDILRFGNTQPNNAKGWNAESILKENFGYNVREGNSKSNRRDSLKRAVNSRNIITLKQIAEHIVFNINIRKGNKNMSSAVERWTEDLEWLKKEFYDKSVHNFRFPNPN